MGQWDQREFSCACMPTTSLGYALSEHNWLSDQIFRSYIANIIELASVLCLGTTYSGLEVELPLNFPLTYLDGYSSIR